MGAREKTGCLSSPALAAAAHRLLRAACLRGPGGGDSPGTVPPGRRARHFVPALRAPRAQGSTRLLPLKVRAAPGPLPAARSRSPGKNWRLKKKRSQERSHWPGLGAPYFKEGRKKNKKKSEKKGCRLEKLLFPPFRKGAENKLPVAASPPEFRGGSDTGLAAGGLRPLRRAQAEPA